MLELTKSQVLLFGCIGSREHWAKVLLAQRCQQCLHFHHVSRLRFCTSLGCARQKLQAHFADGRIVKAAFAVDSNLHVMRLVFYALSRKLVKTRSARNPTRHLRYSAGLTCLSSWWRQLQRGSATWVPWRRSFPERRGHGADGGLSLRMSHLQVEISRVDFLLRLVSNPKRSLWRHNQKVR